MDNPYYYYPNPLYRDWNGKATERTPDTHRYSYEPYVVHKKANEYQNAVYSDRMMQWDYDKVHILSKNILTTLVNIGTIETQKISKTFYVIILTNLILN